MNPASAEPVQPGTLATRVPNFTTREKFKHRVLDTLGFRGFIAAGVGAGIGQALDTPGKWGQGAEGYSKRFISGFAENMSRQTFAFGLETMLHEDSRYYPSDEKGFKERIVSVVRQTYMTHTDSKEQGFAYSRITSAFAAAFLTNAWQPSSNSSPRDGLQRGIIIVGSDAGFNFLQEFVPFFRPKSIRRHQ